MSRDDIIMLAKEAGWQNTAILQADLRGLTRFAALAAAAGAEAEREALCRWIETVFASYERADNIVAAIRARGEKK